MHECSSTVDLKATLDLAKDFEKKKDASELRLRAICTTKAKSRRAKREGRMEKKRKGKNARRERSDAQNVYACACKNAVISDPSVGSLRWHHFVFLEGMNRQ